MNISKRVRLILAIGSTLILLLLGQAVPALAQTGSTSKGTITGPSGLNCTIPVTGSPTGTCSAKLNDLTVVTLKATPGQGWAFEKWDCTGVQGTTKPEFTFTITADVQCKAVFKSATITIVVTHPDGTTKTLTITGVVSPLPTQTLITPLTPLTSTLTLAPTGAIAIGYTFAVVNPTGAVPNFGMLFDARGLDAGTVVNVTCSGGGCLL